MPRLDDKMRDRIGSRIDDHPADLAARTVRAAGLGPDRELCLVCHCRLPLPASSKTLARPVRAGVLGTPSELVFLLVLRDLHAAESLVEPPRPRVVLLDTDIEGEADRLRPRLEVLDDRSTDPAALNAGQQLNPRKLDAIRAARDPQPADPCAAGFDDAGRAVRDLAADLLPGPLGESVAPGRLTSS